MVFVVVVAAAVVFWRSADSRLPFLVKVENPSYGAARGYKKLHRCENHCDVE